MRVRAFAVVLGLGALAATPCLALTVQSAPPRPDVAQHLHSAPTTASSMLPSADEVRNSFLATQRPMIGQGFAGAQTGGTMSYSVGGLRATTTVTPSDAATASDRRRLDEQNPLSLTLPRR